jgi:hypothetical protein
MPPNEQAGFASGAASVGLGQTYVYKATFDALWLFGSGGSLLIRREIFIRSYNMEAGVISCGEDCEIEVYFLDLTFWAEVYTFSLTDAFICSEPCEILRWTG